MISMSVLGIVTLTHLPPSFPIAIGFLLSLCCPQVGQRPMERRIEKELLKVATALRRNAKAALSGPPTTAIFPGFNS
jgi:hypothetical protein